MNNLKVYFSYSVNFGINYSVTVTIANIKNCIKGKLTILATYIERS
jgi:hypothetical protein